MVGIGGDAVIARRVELDISDALIASLRGRANAAGVPLHALLLVAWATLLARWQGRDELAIDVQTGATPGTASVLVQIGDDMTGSALLEAVGRTIAPAMSPAEIDTVRATILSFEGLRLSLIEREGRLIGVLDCSAGLDAESARRMLRCWRVLLNVFAETPLKRIAAMTWLTPEDRYDSLYRFNDRPADFPSEALIHQLFEQQVARTPEAVAVVFEDEELTYAALNAKANRLARHLRERGAGPDRPVGLFMDRSPQLIVSMLAILKAGSAYVPLDPTYPRERVAYMLQDAAPGILLTQLRWLGQCPATMPCVIAVDGDLGLERYAPDNLPPDDITARNLAFVVYTSGSTGAPKGAMNEHRGMVNRILAQRTMERFGDTDVCCQKTFISFVDHVFEIFGALCHGRPLIILADAVLRDPRKMSSVIAERRVTRLITVPSLARTMLEDSQAMRSLAGLRMWTLSGEEVRPELLSKLQSTLPACEFMTWYGSSEVSSDAAFFLSDRPFVGERVPIGRPVPNVRIYILDRHGAPVPLGVIGEIHIGGVGVGRGYLNRADLTAARFIPDTFGDDPHAAIYKTGDLGRWRSDGQLEYFGRNDHQVKLRGMRVELGEIESRLLAVPAVREAVVMAREETPGDPRLVAYCTLRDEAFRADAVTCLRAHMQSVLPDHMVPAAYVVLDRMPQTPNGKLDRRALPAPRTEAFASVPFEAPRGAREGAVARVWTKLLGVERIGRSDSFFGLGGNSLSIVRMVHCLREEGLYVEIADVLRDPTLAGVARLLTPGTFASQPLSRLPDLPPSIVREIAPRVPGGASNIQDIYPLLPLQAGLLFHYLKEDGPDDAYVMGTLLSVADRDRVEQLISALQVVIDRHDVLRTAIVWEQTPEPLQIVLRKATVQVEEIALNRHDDVRKQLLLAPGGRRLDLRRAPLLRLRVAAGPAGACFALLDVHHIIVDDISLRTVISEVMTLLAGCASELPPPVPFRRHVAQVLSRAGKSDAESFFRSKLADIDTPVLPFGLKKLAGNPTERIEEARLVLEGALSKRIVNQARRRGVAPAILFHAAWALVVARTSNRNEVVFGTVLTGRFHGDLEAQSAVGMSINTLPLRLNMEGTAESLLEETRRGLNELLLHEDASLATAQRCSGVGGGEPLFGSVLNFRHSAPEMMREPDHARGVSVLDAIDRTHYPIVLSVDAHGDGFEVAAKVDRCIDPRRLLACMAESLDCLSGALNGSPETPVERLRILPAAEWRRVIHTFNDTRTPFPHHELIHRCFECQVARRPDALAVVHESESLTFAELNHRANQLARLLAARGVGPDNLVGLCLPRGTELVVGLMAVLKAGGAYVPLDPEYPPERLAKILVDAAPLVVLTDTRHRARLPAHTPGLIALDESRPEISRQLTTSPEVAGEVPSQLAYVIYTSGSTGEPKGVMVEHRNVMSLWQGSQQFYERSGPCERVAVNASFNFDSSVKQIVQLLSGRSLILVPEAVRRDARALVRFILEQRVDCIDCTPQQLKAWLAAGLLRSGVRVPALVLIGGEPIDADLWRALASCSNVNFTNVYGPTESTVDTTFVSLQGDRGAPHIGPPMQNRQVYLLDRNRQPVPVGVAGEIYIGGAGVARGYHRQPALTAERFVLDPFSLDGGARLYRSGDVGRWREDGCIEYLGRNDCQIKIRGFRVELAEIEAHLARVQGVRDAVVVAHEEDSGEKRLVAYLTERTPGSLAVEGVRAALRQSLPECMIPGAFMILEALPLTPNGKLDRKALPSPQPQADHASRYERPQGETEEALERIWKEILRRERVGRHDNFFDLGGHSLLAMRLMTRVSDTFDIDLPLTLLFEQPTIMTFGNGIDRLVAQEVPAEAP